MQIFLPLNAGLHWYLAALDAPKREVQILNSAPGVGPTDELDHAVRISFCPPSTSATCRLYALLNTNKHSSVGSDNGVVPVGGRKN